MGRQSPARLYDQRYLYIAKIRQIGKALKLAGL
jgi:hypothetical protein